MKPSNALIVFSLANGLFAGMGCSSSDNAPPALGPSGTTAAVAGPSNDRCVNQPASVVDPAACMTPASSGDGAGGAADEDSAAGTAGASAASDCNLAHDASYGDSLYGSAGDDDDCKYHVSWTSTPVAVNQDVSITVTATLKDSTTPLEGLSPGTNALSRVELYLPCEPTHFPPAADARPTIKETLPGVYTAGPIRFDKPGRWVVRFHFFESCLDQEASPHGHIAFFVDVPG